MDGHPGQAGHDLRHRAVSVRIEMLYNDKGQAAIRRHCSEELFNGFQSAGGSADTHDM